MHIIGIDDRGSNMVAFGYVYFGDGHRVAYLGGTAYETGPMAYEVLHSSGDWGKQPTAAHREAAQAHLNEHGITGLALAGR